MAKTVNSDWKKEMLSKLDLNEEIDITSSFTPAISWLVEIMSRRNKAFRLYNVGAGVKRVTTTTDKCPCCKRNL